jgi:CubicO group peptidase (beta-lactamase class C family)
MNGTAAKLLLTILLLVAAVACGRAAPPAPTPSPSKAPVDYVALKAEIERVIDTGPTSMDNLRAVLVSVDGETKIAHYRHRFTEDDYLHVWSVTKSVLSILIGIAIADGLIAGLDQPLSELLPDHRQSMSDATAQTTLRQLMTMSGGFDDFLPAAEAREKPAAPGRAYVDLLLERPQYPPGSAFWYSNPSAHLVAAVLASALKRADGEPRTVLDYAREKLFGPLGIPTRNAFSRPLTDFSTPEFDKAGFGWGTDPDGIQIGGFGLRLRAPDLLKIGELYRRGGVWNGQQIVPADWIQQSIAPSIHKDDYGLHWWLINEPEGAGYAARGYGGQTIIVLPTPRVVVAYLSAVPSDGQVDDSAFQSLDNVFTSAFL